jgi:hypothetical protein
MINLYGSSDIPTQYLRATALQQPIDGLAQQYLYYHELRRNAAITRNPTTGRKHRAKEHCNGPFFPSVDVNIELRVARDIY